MAAAYGALLSVTNTIHQILNHPRPPISLDKLRIEPLIEKVAFLQDFLEKYIIDDADGLEGRMVDAARKVEDIIESRIAHHFEDEYEDSLYLYVQKMMEESDAVHEAEDIIQSHTADHIEVRGVANISSRDNESLYRELQEVMGDLDSITKDVAAIKEKAGKNIAPSCTEDDAMEASDDVMNNIMDKLNNNPSSKGDDTMAGVMNNVMDTLTNQQSGRRIIAIAGMGGIGKTTLAKKIYEHPYVVQYFDIRGWTTVSQEFDSKRILLQVLGCLKNEGSEDDEYEELGQNLYQSLYGQRFLIVMDDIWGTDAWDKVKRFFPKNNDGSRVLITTRPSKLAMQLDSPDYFQMPFLKVDESWNLLRGCVFGEQRCPLELEEIGKDIAGECRGLPLSIVVIGGLLAKSERTRENWQHVAENLSSIVNLEDDERCFRILKLSYNQLPVHLKPCFLYMGMYPEDYEIHVPTLLKLWVDEGFVKPVAGKSLKTVARVAYLHGLVLRNLILVRERGLTRRIKYCGIHDLLRDLCIKEAEKYKFFRTTKTTHNPDPDQSWRAQRRIGIHQAEKYIVIPRPLPEAVQSASRARTMIWNANGILPSVVPFRLLRILNGHYRYAPYKQTGELRLKELFLLVNLRHLFIIAVMPEIEFPPELYLVWNLRTLIFTNFSCLNRPVLDIWRMPQLRHVKVACGLRLTDPPPMEEENGWMVLENLETLKTVDNMRLSEKLVERIPNIKKLELWYDEKGMELSLADYGLWNLWRLHKLEALQLRIRLDAFVGPDWEACSIDLTKIEVAMFPVSLRKLFLHGTCLGWEKMGTEIGLLPHLEELQILCDAFVGPEWETAEGGFPSLKYLCIYECNDLEQWMAEAMHFPCLERLELTHLIKLKEIPLGIGDIPTLREIHLQWCNDSTVLSAKKILEEQELCLGKVELHIKVLIFTENSQLREESFKSSPNFTVSYVKPQQKN